MNGLFRLLLVAALGLVLGIGLTGSLAQASCPLSGSYQVQGKLPGASGSLTLNIKGKFVNSGVSGCFTSGTGSYGLNGIRGGLAVHTDWTTYWSNTTGLFLPSVANSGGLVGQEMVIVACLRDGSLQVPTKYPNGGTVYLPGPDTTNFPCQPGAISAWFITISSGCITCWDPTSPADFAGLGTVSLK